MEQNLTLWKIQTCEKSTRVDILVLRTLHGQVAGPGKGGQEQAGLAKRWSQVFVGILLSGLNTLDVSE